MHIIIRFLCIYGVGSLFLGLRDICSPHYELGVSISQEDK